MPESDSHENAQKALRTLKAFFEDCPPQTVWQLDPVSSLKQSQHGLDQYELALPQIQLFCKICDGLTNFAAEHPLNLTASTNEHKFVHYTCRNCDSHQKTFAITIRFGKTSTGLNAVKYGEYPPFGPPLPARLQRLFQGDVELLKKGFRAEKWGFGVAAFTYYRQVLERQRDRLFERIIEAAAAVNAPQRTIDKLKEAKSNRQFSTSLEQAKEVFPESLMIVGQNPMAVLHRVCSEAIHNHTDEECLDIAITTRKLLIAFSERLAEAIKSQTEIEDSLKKLMQSPKKLS